MVIVSATLLDAWNDLSGLLPGQGLGRETERFLADWEASHNLDTDFQLAVGRLRNMLLEVSRWLDQAEAGLSDDPSKAAQPALRDEFYREVREPLLPKFAELYGEFEATARRVSDEVATAHKSYARRELHPLTLCSPFVHRTFTKPLGYAGDFEMVNMMLGESAVSVGNTYARVIHSFHLQSAAAEAHRNRIEILQDRLRREAERVVLEDRPFSVLNIACGPAVEFKRFVASSALADFTVFHAIDFSTEALEYARTAIEETIASHDRKTVVEFEQKSIDELLRETDGQTHEPAPQYDFVYCAGLFDYFTDPVCRRLIRLFFQWVKPGGLATVTNVHPDNPNRPTMEYLLEWYLVYRDENAMEKLARSVSQKQVCADGTGLNVFLDLRKDF
jgi:extracellular factor (EF) 3-hydroxypalmitic acid methyl ester biosynthesis protein